jgi:hypothetical protein
MANMRSPNYPQLGLSEAITRVRSLWSKEKRTAVPLAVAATAIGYGSVSGPSRSAVAAMKKYGLVDSDDRNLSVSALALRILHPADSEDALQALREAALKPELFAQLYQSHRHASDDALQSFLINKMSFSQRGATQLIKSFRDTIELAKLDQTDYIPSAVTSVEATLQSQSKQAGEMEYVGGDGTQHKVSAVQSWSWPLSMPRNVRADLKITGDLTLADVRRLKKQIENMEDAFDEASEIKKTTD